MQDLLTGLNEAQKEAVLHKDAPLLILAGAGSGKTRVITVKIAWLISRLGIDPLSILAVTFTNKAAQEMRQRAAMMEPRASDVMIRTFHSFGSWLLRRNTDAAGLHRRFSIYDDDDVLSLLGTLFPQQNRAMLSSYARQISRAKDYAIGPDGDLRPIMEKPDLPEVYAAYEKRLREIGNCDFGDLIFLCIQLLRNRPEIRHRLQERFRVILVDEYQDSNVAQYELLRELVGPHSYICVVGDDDQSIYRFRGAEVRNIVSFPERFPGTKVVRLEQNYRSTNPILKLASAVVERNENRLGKTMWTARTDGISPRLMLFGDQDQETSRIVRILQDGAWEGTAILYRTNAQSRAYETAFLNAGIAYKIIGTLRFYEREEIKDALALMRIVANPKDELAFRRIVNKPARGIGAGALLHIVDRLPDSGGNLLHAADYAIPKLNKKAGIGLRSFLDAVDRLRNLMNDNSKEDDVGRASESGKTLDAFLEIALSLSGLKDFYHDEDQVNGTQKEQNIDELMNAASLFTYSYEGLAEFLEVVELDSSREVDDHSGERVTLITMHNTKGLEFDRVIVCGLEDGLFPRAGEDSDELEEERRLFYVALTRARNELILTSCHVRRLHGKIIEFHPSRFLSEIPKELIAVDDFGYGRLSPGGISRLHQSQQGPIPAYPRGTRIYHDDYGTGEVVKNWFNGSDEMVIVRFETGKTAQFIPKYTSLERISG